MNICNSRNHEEIVFDSRECPLCVSLDWIEELESKMEDIKEKLENMEIQERNP